MVLSVREKVSRRWRAFTELMVPDYWGSDACHVAHRALAAARQRAHKEEKEQEVEQARDSSISLAGEEGQGSCEDIEAGGGGNGVYDQKQQQQLVVRGSSNSTGPRTLVVPYYGEGTEEGGSPEEEQVIILHAHLPSDGRAKLDVNFLLLSPPLPPASTYPCLTLPRSLPPSLLPSLPPPFSTASHIYAICMSLIVILSCFSYILGTISHFRYLPPTCARPVCVPSPTSPCLKTICYPQPKPAIHRVEDLSMILFSLDYFTRVFLVHAVPCALVCPEDWAKGLLPHTMSRGK